MSLVSNQLSTALSPRKLSPKQLIIEVHADRGVLIAGDKQTCLGQQLATTLLVALIDAANRSQTVSSKVLIQHWHQHNPRALPDRTAIARAAVGLVPFAPQATPVQSRFGQAAPAGCVGASAASTPLTTPFASDLPHQSAPPAAWLPAAAPSRSACRRQSKHRGLHVLQ